MSSATYATQASAACADADLIDTIPPDGAAGVPTNTPLMATYDVGATHNGEGVLVTRRGSNPEQLAGTYSTGVSTLTARPLSGMLEPNAEYTVEWPGLLTGDNPPRQGEGAVIRFTTGTGPDTSRPTFEGARAVRWDFEREYDGCSDTESERYVFGVRLPTPTYSGGVELLTVLAFQTKGKTLPLGDDGQPQAEPVYAARYTGSEWIAFKRPVADGVGHVCFSAIVQAPGGSISGGSEHEVCTRTEHPPFFDGCAVLSTSTRSRGASSLLLFALAAACRRRRKGSSASFR